MPEYSSPHYLFHYDPDSPAERDIRQIAAVQEACFRYICDVLQTQPEEPIHYYLRRTPEEVGRDYGDNEPCNGFARIPGSVYAVYNDRVRCIGFHEDAHLISERIGHPDCPAIREGLAMYFDRRWWGIHNLDWAIYYYDSGSSPDLPSLLDRTVFFSFDCSVTYPIMGAFTEWLISSFGLERYRAFYAGRDALEGMRRVYGKAPSELSRAFAAYLRLFSLDDAIRARIEALLPAGQP